MNKELNLKIEDLFRWKGEIAITDLEGNVIETLYQRVIGDGDVQKCRIDALRASKILRKELRNKDSDAYLIHMPIEGERTKDELMANVLYYKSPNFQLVSEARLEEERVKSLKNDATLEDQEQHIEKLENARQKYKDKVNEDIKRQSEALLAELEEKSYEEIYELHTKELTELLCRQEFIRVFEESAVMCGTYKDSTMKHRRFHSLDELNELASRIKKKLIDNYQTIEMNLVEVKK